MKVPKELFVNTLNNWFASKGMNPLKCPNCGKLKLRWNPTLFELREYHKGNIKLGKSRIMPIITATCDNCGFVVSLSAIKIKLIDSKTGDLFSKNETEENE